MDAMHVLYVCTCSSLHTYIYIYDDDDDDTQEQTVVSVILKEQKERDKSHDTSHDAVPAVPWPCCQSIHPSINQSIT